MSKLKSYFQVTADELMNKVSWPTWEELQQSTVIVVIASIIIALLVLGMDRLSDFILGIYYDLFN